MYARIPGLLAAFAVWVAPAGAQEPEAPHVTIPVVEPRAEDVETIDGIVAAFYETVSGPVGRARDWGRDATLYLEPISFTVLGIDAETGRPSAETISKQEFVDRSDRWLTESGFVEREIHRETRRFGNMAQVWSTYEWVTDDGATGRGINGIHLYHDGSRWWITHATWDAEREGAPIPPEYLP